VILSPPNSLASDSDRVIFLAGPVQGARDWQKLLCEMVLDKLPDAVIATPRATGFDKSTFEYDAQVRWEQTMLRKAGFAGGVIVFWLEAQDHSIPYEIGRAYAQTTRFEIGEAIGWRSLEDKVSIIIGIDPGYTPNGGGSENYVRWLAHEYDIGVLDSLEAVGGSVVKAFN
jgi:hypothetical protein